MSISFQTISTNVTVTSFVSMTTFKMEPWEFLVPVNRFCIFILYLYSGFVTVQNFTIVSMIEVTATSKQHRAPH